jgi:type IV pilus assembly protein PilO
MTAANLVPLDEPAAGGITLFGFTLTGKVLGIIIAVVGIGGAAYGTYAVTVPLQEQIDATRSAITSVEGEIANLKTQVAGKEALKAKLAEAKRQNQFVFSLLPTIDNIDTLLLDLNNQIPPKTNVSIGQISLEIDSRLANFTPKGITEASQYRIFSFEISYDSTFPAAIQTIRNIERLRSFVVVKNIKLTKKAVPPNLLTFPPGVLVTPEDNAKIIANLPPVVGVSFTLEAYVPNPAAPTAANPPAQ